MKTLLALIVFTAVGIAQTVYEIPFPTGTSSTTNNTIELSVSNTSKLTAEAVKVSVSKTPDWIKFTSTIDTIQQVKANGEQTALFSFSVDKKAEINKEQTLSFTITDKNNQTWTKDITIKVLPPTTFELFQNYPNPFNPTTIISYQLPGDVGTQFIASLKVYDIRGREVANLVNEQQDAGYHQITFDAHRLSSGVYFYKLFATDDQSKQHSFQKKLVLVK